MDKDKNWFARHPIWTGIMALVLIGFIWSVVSQQDSDSTSVSTLTQDYTASNVEPIMPKAKVNITLTGDSDTVTDSVRLAQGTYLVKAIYGGDSNFIVSVLNQDGDSSTIFNEIGRYEGTTSIQADGGEYRFQVEIGTSYNGGRFNNKAPWTIQVHGD